MRQHQTGAGIPPTAKARLQCPNVPTYPPAPQRLTIELIEPTNKPPIVAINWPPKPTITTPATYDQVAANAMRLLAAATVELAAIKVWRKL